MAGIGSKTHDFEDMVFRRDDNSFTDVGKTHKVPVQMSGKTQDRCLSMRKLLQMEVS